MYTCIIYIYTRTYDMHKTNFAGIHMYICHMCINTHAHTCYVHAHNYIIHTVTLMLINTGTTIIIYMYVIMYVHVYIYCGKCYTSPKLAQ